jgi:hypothetical protein
LLFSLKFSDKNFNQPNCFLLNICLPYNVSETDDKPI